MSHLGQEVLLRILRGEGGPQETESIAEHLLACDSCRTLAGTLITPLRGANPRLRGEGSLQRVFDRIDQEHQRGIEALTAIAEWAELRRLARQNQRDRVRMSKGCHTLAFCRLLVDELKEAPAWEESEFLARLALLSVEAMGQRQLITPPAGHDLQVEIWTAVANARRRAAEWGRAHQALANAERHRKEGTRDRRLEAGLLSIAASTFADEGHRAQALETLEKCRAIYDDLSEWALVARALVQRAHILEPTEPAKGLVALDHAAPLIPIEDLYLRLLTELLRVECLIGVDNRTEALRVFQRSSHLMSSSLQIRLRIRGRFTCARLLDSFEYHQQAERLFLEVVDRDIENDLYKDAFLDLLHLYGHHVKREDFEKAARVCRRALTDPTLAALAHEQLRTVWEQLLEATQRQAIGQDLLRELRQYFTAHWKNPAAHPPVVTSR